MTIGPTSLLMPTLTVPRLTSRSRRMRSTSEHERNECDRVIDERLARLEKGPGGACVATRQQAKQAKQMQEHANQIQRGHTEPARVQSGVDWPSHIVLIGGFRWKTPREVIIVGVMQFLQSSGWASCTLFLGCPFIHGSIAQLTFPSPSQAREACERLQDATAGYVLA